MNHRTHTVVNGSTTHELRAAAIILDEQDKARRKAARRTAKIAAYRLAQRRLACKTLADIAGAEGASDAIRIAAAVELYKIASAL